MIQNYFKDLMRRFLRLNYKTYFAILLLSFGTSLFNAQVSAYNFSQSNGSYTGISGGTVLGTATANSGAIPSLDTTSFPVTLPFGFVFNGQTYTDLNVSTNGYVTFGTGAATTTAPISTTLGWNGAISAWGRSVNAVFDIAGKTGNISWTIEGSAPNRVAVIQWENVKPVSSTSTTNVFIFSFQIRLAETTGVIQTKYSAGAFLVGSTAVASTAQIGLRGATNADFNNRTNATTIAFENSTVGTLNSSSQAFNSNVNPPGMPADGLTYTWTPPTCVGPTTLSVSNITTTSVDLAWNASISAPANGYDIYYSTSNVAPVSTTTPNFTGLTGLSQNIAGLNPSSTYYVWVRAVCSNTDASNWAALPTFNTQCVPVNDMFENFDSSATGSVVPNCWDRIISGSGTQTINTTTPNSTPNNLYMFSSLPANQTIVVLPVFGNINAGTHWLRFKARTGTAPRTIDVGYVTNATDASTFVIIESKSITNTAYTSLDSEYTVAIPTTLPTGARLAIRNPGTLSTTFYFDDIYWEIAPTCLPPANLGATNVTTTTATISWGASVSAPANGYDVYFSTVNNAPIATTAPNFTGVTGLSQALSGLSASTNYFVWLRSVCSGTDKSTWTALPSFATQCDAITGSYFEDFEAYPGVGNGAAGGILPICWNNLGTAQGGHIASSATSVVSGTKGLYLWTSGTTYVAFVALPAMSTLQSGNYKLKFDAKASVTANGILQIGYLDTTNTFVQLTTFSVPTVGTVYPFEFDIPVLPAGVTQLALRNPGIPANSLSIDNLSYELKTLSTSEVAGKNSLNIYPNPFTDFIRISDIKDVVSISITDLSGRLVKSIAKPSSELNVSGLKTGMYLIQLKLKDGSFQTVKAIKK